MRAIVFCLGLLLCPTLSADRIVLSTGDSFDGDFFGATSQEIRFVVDGKLMYFQTSEVVLIQLGQGGLPETGAACEPCAPVEAEPGEAAPSPPRAEPAEQLPAPVQRARTEEKAGEPDRPTLSRRRANAEPGVVTPSETTDEVEAAHDEAANQPFSIRPGTHLLVRLEEEVDSELHHVGQTFRASLERAIYAADREAIPAGTEVVARLVNSRDETESNRSGSLALDLVAIVLDGQQVNIVTNEVTQSGDSRGTKGKVKEGLSRAGTRLGTILAGSTVGRTAGDTVETATRADAIRIEAGTILDFTLRNSIEKREGVPGDAPQPRQLMSSASR